MGTLTVWRVQVVQSGGRASEIGVARVLGVPLGDAAIFLKQLPTEIPLNLSHEKAEAVAADLTQAGCRTVVREVVNATSIGCQRHPHLSNDGQCKRCNAWICGVCRSQNSQGLCWDCARKTERSAGFRAIRIGVLLTVLMLVIGFAWRHHQQGLERRAWDRPLNVHLVLVQNGNALDAEVLQALKARVPELETVLATQYQAWGKTGLPFRIRAVGPVKGVEPPSLNADGWWARVTFTYALHQFQKEIDHQVAEPAGDADIRIYMVLRAPTGRVRDFEGIAAQGGTVGLVEIDLAEDMVVLALVTAAHELFHTLGASDKYSLSGDNVMPMGLAEPEKEPLFPQVAQEIMARKIQLSEDETRLPRHLNEIRVNRYTAEEIGWLTKK